jgi:hypothetical protein
LHTVSIHFDDSIPEIKSMKMLNFKGFVSFEISHECQSLKKQYSIPRKNQIQRFLVFLGEFTVLFVNNTNLKCEIGQFMTFSESPKVDLTTYSNITSIWLR